MEGEAVEVDFVAAGELALVAADCRLSELLNCGDCAISFTLLTTNTHAASVDAMSRARYICFPTHFVVLLLIGFRFSPEFVSTGTQARLNFCMIAKKVI